MTLFCCYCCCFCYLKVIMRKVYGRGLFTRVSISCTQSTTWFTQWWTYNLSRWLIDMIDLKTTYSNTVLSFWSPQMRISAIWRNVSTNRVLFCSVTTLFLDITLHKYLRCSKDNGFFGFEVQ